MTTKEIQTKEIQTKEIQVTYDQYEIEVMRRRKGLTQIELADKLGVTAKTYQRWLKDLEKMSIKNYNQLIAEIKQ